MNKVRLIAVVAASVGAAVFAGTLFQPEAPQSQTPQPRAATQPTPSPSLLPAGSPATPSESGVALAMDGMAPAPASADVPRMAEPLPVAASLLPTLPAQRPVDPSAEHVVGGLVANLDPAAPQIDDALRAELDACAIWLVVTPEPGGMLETSLFAPCDAGAAIEIVHGGLSFDTVLGRDGQLLFQMPALADMAEVVVTFADGREASDTTPVPGFADHERVVLQWSGAPVWGLHAFEFGARYGAGGHVHADAPQAAGSLTLLGDPALDMPRLAQVYSLPPAAAAASGDVVIDIEIAVTAESCGRQIRADLLHVRANAPVRQNQIALTMPDCDGAGGFVVLNNLLPAMTLALN